MRRRVLLVLVLAAGVVRPVEPSAQAARIPTFCDITAAQKEVQAGARVTFTVSLKNVKNVPVAALADTTVTLTSESFAAPVQVVVPQGQDSATATAVMAKPGIGRVKASAPNWPAAFTIVPVKSTGIRRLTLPESASSKELLLRMGGAGGGALSSPTTAVLPAPVLGAAPPPRAGTAGRAGPVITARRGLGGAGRATVSAGGGTAAPQPAPPPAPEPAPAPGGPSSVALDVQVNPEQVFPRAHQWAADVIVLLLGGDGNLAVADRDLQLQLTTRVGQIEPRAATIHAGDSSTAATSIKLTSNQSGDELITALSTIARTTREVKFDQAQVASLRVTATPSRVVNDGRVSVSIAVLLQDADGRVTEDQSRDYKVHLDSDLGTFDKSDLTIPKGDSSAETDFASPRYGTAAIKATGVGVEGATTVALLFPWVMLALATVGGAGGSLAREGFTPPRRRSGVPPFVRHLAIGALFGLVFFALAMFGAVGSIPKIDIGKIIPLNDIGALLLGFIGGYLGNRFWASDDEGGAPKPKKDAAGGDH